MKLLLDIMYILFVHWVADFVYQSDRMAKNKSKNNGLLASHVAVYTLITTVSWWISFSLSPKQAFLMLVITYVTHFITDYITSRINSRLWAAGDSHNFFVSVGFDQLIHYATLFLSLYYILSF